MASRSIQQPTDPGTPDYAALAAANRSPIVRTLPVRPTRTETSRRSLGTDSSNPTILFYGDPTRSRGMVYNDTGQILYVSPSADDPYLPVAAGDWFDTGSVGVLYAYLETTAATVIVAEEIYGA